MIKVCCTGRHRHLDKSSQLKLIFLISAKIYVVHTQKNNSLNVCKLIGKNIIIIYTHFFAS